MSGALTRAESAPDDEWAEDILVHSESRPLEDMMESMTLLPHATSSLPAHPTGTPSDLQQAAGCSPLASSYQDAHLLLHPSPSGSPSHPFTLMASPDAAPTSSSSRAPTPNTGSNRRNEQQRKRKREEREADPDGKTSHNQRHRTIRGPMIKNGRRSMISYLPHNPPRPRRKISA